MSLILILALFAIRPLVCGTILAGIGIVKLTKLVAHQMG